jgi:cysteine desulfurase
MGEAFSIAKTQMLAESEKILMLRKLFLQGIAHIKNITLNGSADDSVPGILNLCVSGMTAQNLMRSLPEIALSAGSACGTKGSEPSYVLRAMGLSHAEAKSSVRVSLGRFTTQDDIECAIKAMASRVVNRQP